MIMTMIKINRNLNENEKKIFIGAIRSSSGNGYDFGFASDVHGEVEGFSVNSVKGYLGSLTKKGLIEIEDAPKEIYDGQMVIVGLVKLEEYWKKTPEELAELLLENPKRPYFPRRI